MGEIQGPELYRGIPDAREATVLRFRQRGANALRPNLNVNGSVSPLIPFPTRIDIPNTTAESPLELNYDMRPHVDGRYHIEIFRRERDPVKAQIVEGIQGRSYEHFGYVTLDALVNPKPMDDPLSDWSLLERFDSARPNNKIDVEYFLGTPNDPSKPEMGRGGLRIVTAKPGHLYSELPAYEHSEKKLFDSAKTKIKERVALYGDGIVKELAGLSLEPEAIEFDSHNVVHHPSVSFELMREPLQRAIRNQTNELWLINFADRARRQLLKACGPLVLERAGENVMAHANDAPEDAGLRSETLELTPTLVEPCMLLDNMLYSIRMMEQNPGMFERYSQYLLAHNIFSSYLVFMADGLRKDELSEEVGSFIDSFEAEK